MVHIICRDFFGSPKLARIGTLVRTGKKCRSAVCGEGGHCAEQGRSATKRVTSGEGRGLDWRSPARRRHGGGMRPSTYPAERDACLAQHGRALVVEGPVRYQILHRHRVVARAQSDVLVQLMSRSEERRVGKE